jgi:hypothetical protein
VGEFPSTSDYSILPAAFSCTWYAIGGRQARPLLTRGCRLFLSPVIRDRTADVKSPALTAPYAVWAPGFFCWLLCLLSWTLLSSEKLAARTAASGSLNSCCLHYGLLPACSVSSGSGCDVAADILLRGVPALGPGVCAMSLNLLSPFIRSSRDGLYRLEQYPGTGGRYQILDTS